ncbi:hypothetical protein ACE939_03875 [Aquimarina sp. W85]|uniref:hypothetical protein n=1 Tax=Aquimarina rhodophyticola TaxID=3342246 RepID=UPI00366CBDD5
MNKLIALLLISSFLCACDDGDIIITSFEFDDVELQLCEGSGKNEFVFFKLGVAVNEAIALTFKSDEFSNIVPTVIPIKINLATNEGALTYRKFSSEVPTDYFCSIVPPTNVTITEELFSLAGNATIVTDIILEDDDDGVPAEDEDINNDGNLENDDTDKDGIPNYKDADDDDDNIPTIIELPNNIPDNDDPRDSDEDGIPDYLDNDDDNDGILTRNEDTNGEDGPRADDDNNDNIPNYLQVDQITEYPTAINNFNTIKTTYRTSVSITELALSSESQTLDSDTYVLGFKDTTIDKINEKDEK